MKGESVLRGIELNNFRSLKNTGPQTISPITVLVGENSSGKSSFLRAFPLLKQSIIKRTSGPILWSGDVDDYVDFGSFGETLTKDGSSSIEFKFYFAISDYIGPSYRRNRDENKKVDVTFRIVIVSKLEKENVKQFDLTLNDTVFSFDLINRCLTVSAKNKVSVFNFDKKERVDNDRVYFYYHNTIAFCSAFGFNLPSIRAFLLKQYESLLDREEMGIESNEDTDDDDEISQFEYFRLISLIGKHLIQDHDLDKNELFSLVKKELNADEDVETLSEIFEKLINDPQKSQYNMDLFKLLYAYNLFDSIDQYLTSYFKNVHYIAPLRATAERYYRLRNLAVDEVDYQGKNLAIFINSLNGNRLRSFQTWTSQHFGFSVYTNKGNGHLSLLIKLNDSSEKINLSDTGFGYSQVLPIITQMWELSSRTRNRNNYYESDSLTPLVVAIEQPELHLHPALQAKLARAFIACINLAREHGYQLQLLVETHSETIVNYFGRAIAKGALKTEDVSVIMFEKNDTSGITQVKKSTYDENGFLTNWPYGFFEAEE